MSGHGAVIPSALIITASVAVAAAVVLAAHAALLPLGAWFPDEYIQFAQHQRFGWRQVAERMFGWSPRPISELLLFGYSSAVAWLDRPGVAWILAATWAGGIAILLLAGRLARIGIVLPLAMAAAVLLVARPGEMWYWPAAALAYVPALAGLCAAAVLLAGPRRGGRVDAAICASLLLAAGSVELGAIAALLLCAGQFLRHGLGRWIPQIAPEQGAWVWIPPLALAGGIMVGLVANRVGAALEVFAPSGTVGETWLSLAAATRHLADILGGVPADPDLPADLRWGIPVKLAFLAGFWALLPPGPVSMSARLTCLTGAAAMLATTFASMVLAYRQFGMLCCERHETFRQGLLVVAAMLLAASLARPPAAFRRSAAMLALAGAFAALFWMRVPALRHDLALRPRAAEVRAANWAAGRAATDSMRFVAEPAGRITRGWALEPGVYRREDRSMSLPPGMTWHAFAVMLFFDKLELRSP
ncbi:hypothetical protein GXW74_02650 [Roseomonas eburnea]|uniref:Uncharacterized protein n=1 Tax=Neoroseomonas eburnea TaxID=1346889 RepID=A0A9X9X6N7_9PROT|nr:hypothetical protein [Neoroseomonas eburnea]MBR0679373.1 hypothetical protein [Neoroseomonas eburnea]